MYQALYRKYRPKTLEDVYGQQTIIQIIKNSVINNKINHAYLFTGPRGTGKTSVAKIFAKLVNCENPKNSKPCGKCISCSQKNNSDIIEIDAASNNGVDEIRELRNKISLVPAYGKYKVYIIDEVHMLTTGAFNALLKTLEEPPKHIIFILATTDPYKIPETILSRCQRLDFKKIGQKSIIQRLKVIVEKEKINISEDALEEIANLSDGGMRDSIGMLDQANSYTKSRISVQDIHDINGTITPSDLKELLELINEKKLDKIFKKLDFYNECGKNFVKLTEEFVIFLRDILIMKEAPEYLKNNNINTKIYAELIDKFDTNVIIQYIDILNDSLNKMKNTNNPKLMLEISLIKILENNENVGNKETKVEKSTDNKKSSKTLLEDDKKNILNDKLKINYEKLTELKEIRINNTLAKFKKREIINIKEKLIELKKYLLNPDYSKYASMLLDGILKAASDENLIFVYKNERLAILFNENIQNIEKILKKILKKEYKVIATDADDWSKIKDEFNNKKRTYKYQKELNLNLVFEKTNTNEDFSEFKDIIEYK